MPNTVKVKKVQTMLLVDPPVRDRSDILSLIKQTTRAEIYRQAIEIGLREMEAHQHPHGVIRFRNVAKRFGMTPEALAQAMVKDGLSIADVTGQDTYPGARAA